MSYLKEESKLLHSAEQARSSKESLKMLVYVYFIKLHDLNHITYVSLKAFCYNLIDSTLFFSWTLEWERGS